MENRTSLLLNTLKRHRYATLAQQLSATALMITLPSSALAPSSEAVIESYSSSCPEVSATTDDLDREVDVIIEEVAESIVKREGDGY